MSDRENYGPGQPPANEQVGYGMPPMRRRFKVSGNPKGRPRGVDFYEWLESVTEEIPVDEL